jgi:tripartite-type tricarboxylate transporter receptor subunit TctC
MKVLAFAALGLIAGWMSASAQEYPARPVRLLIGFAAGGSGDIVGRIVAQPASEGLRQSVVIENRAGASGVIATEVVARAAPDGHTLILGTMTTHALAPALNARLPYDVMRDFAPVLLLGRIPLLMSVSPAVSANSLNEFISLAKASPGRYTFASAGDGSPAHMAGELLRRAVGIELLHVPYKGTGPAVADLMAGQVSTIIDGAPAQIAQIKAGKLRALAVASDKRLVPLPGLATFAEQGVAGMEISLWYGIYAPAATPAPVLGRLNAEFNRVLALPEVRQRFADLSVEPGGGSAAQFASFNQTELLRWAQVVRQSNIKLE